MSENTNKSDPKVEKVNDLVAVITIMEDYWRFHPANPNKEDVVKEYDQLSAIKESLEKEIEKLDVNSKG